MGHKTNRESQRCQRPPGRGAGVGWEDNCPPLLLHSAAWAGAASTQVAPEQGAAAAFWKRARFGLPRPAVTAPEQTWVIGNERAWPCAKKTLFANPGRDLALAAGPALEKGWGGDSWKSIAGPPRQKESAQGTPSLTPSRAGRLPGTRMCAVHCQESKGLTRERVKPRPDG